MNGESETTTDLNSGTGYSSSRERKSDRDVSGGPATREENEDALNAEQCAIKKMTLGWLWKI